MASNQFIILAIATILLPTVAMATEYMVGDDNGWTIVVDYQAWAEDKVFMVGDQLVFKYNASNHNVFKVNGTAFEQCIVPPANEALDSGYDIITLATPGQKWYICGKPTHCSYFFQKLAINVAEAPAPAPTMSPPAPAPYFAAHGMAKKIRFWMRWN